MHIILNRTVYIYCDTPLPLFYYIMFYYIFWCYIPKDIIIFTEKESALTFLCKNDNQIKMKVLSEYQFNISNFLVFIFKSIYVIRLEMHKYDFF